MMSQKEQQVPGFIIDRESGIKISANLVDKQGQEINLQDTINKLDDFIQSKLRVKEPNSMNSKILPFMTRVMAHALLKIVGQERTSIILTDNSMQALMIDLMLVSFSLYKIMQSKGYTIESIIEDIDLEQFDKDQIEIKLRNVATFLGALGIDPHNIFNKLLEEGLVTEEEVNRVLADMPVDDDMDDLES